MPADNDTAEVFLIRLTVSQIESLQAYIHGYESDWCVGDECRRECEAIYEHLEKELSRVQGEVQS